MDRTISASTVTRVVGTAFCVAAILIALINNHTYQWAIGVPLVLAVVGVGLRIEAMLTSRSQEDTAGRTVPSEEAAH